MGSSDRPLISKMNARKRRRATTRNLQRHSGELNGLATYLARRFEDITLNIILRRIMPAAERKPPASTYKDMLMTFAHADLAQKS
jgi:hypothetical protein